MLRTSDERSGLLWIQDWGMISRGRCTELTTLGCGCYCSSSAWMDSGSVSERGNADLISILQRCDSIAPANPFRHASFSGSVKQLASWQMGSGYRHGVHRGILGLSGVYVWGISLCF